MSDKTTRIWVEYNSKPPIDMKLENAISGVLAANELKRGEVVAVGYRQIPVDIPADDVERIRAQFRNIRGVRIG